MNIIDNYNLARYCKPATISANGKPSSTAFQLRKNEEYLSTECLEYFNLSSEDKSIPCAIKIINEKLHISNDGKIAVLNVGEIKNSIKRELDFLLLIKQISNDSHVGIFFTEIQNLVISHIISNNIKNIYNIHI